MFLPHVHLLSHLIELDILLFIAQSVRKGVVIEKVYMAMSKRGLKFQCSAAAAGISCKWVPVEIYVYFLHRKYQLKPLLFAWFSTVCFSTVIYRRKQCILKYYRIKHHNKSA